METQKLELMSAMSELKLQQAVLERENLELRASHFNNNTIGADRRLPPVPNARIRKNSSSGSMVISYFQTFCEQFYIEFIEYNSNEETLEEDLKN